MARGSRTKKSTDTELGDEAQRWNMADAFRINMVAAESPHVAEGRAVVALFSRTFDADPPERAAAAASGAIPASRHRLVAPRIRWIPSKAPS